MTFTLIPEMVLPSVLLLIAGISIYVNLYKDKYKQRGTGIKAVLTRQALEEDPFWSKYKIARDTQYKLKCLGLSFDYRIFILGNMLIALILAMTSIFILNNKPLVIVTPVLWLIFAHQLVDNIYRKKVKAKIDHQAQLFLQLLAEIHDVSDNLTQAIGRVIPSTSDPLRGELEKLVLKLKTNENLHDSLIEFASKVDNDDIKTFVHGIVLADQFGAESHEVITKNAEVIRERLALKEELENETKGKKAIIIIFMVLLPVIFLWLFIGSPDTRNVFTDTVRGQYILLAVIVAEYLCWYYDSRKGGIDEI